MESSIWALQSTTPDVAAYSWLVPLPLKSECSSLSENGHERIDLNPKYCEVFPIMKAAQCGTSRCFLLGRFLPTLPQDLWNETRDRLEIRQRRFFFVIFGNKHMERTDLARCAAVGSQVVHMAALISSFQLISTVCRFASAWHRVAEERTMVLWSYVTLVFRALCLVYPVGCGHRWPGWL